MSLPTNKIKKVKLPNNTEYDIVPSMLQDGTTTNKLSVPTLTQDNDEVVTTKTNQTMSGDKDFSGSVVLNNYPLRVQADNEDAYTGEDWDTSFYPDKVEITNYSESDAVFTLQYPKLSDGETKTFATTSDLTEIVDLTSIQPQSGN